VRNLVDRLSAGLIVLALFTASGLYVRVVAARHCVYPTVDGVYYLEQSRALVLHHRLPFSSFPPGWPALAAIPLAFADAHAGMAVLRSAQGVNVALGLLWCLLTYSLLRRELPAWLAVAGAAVLLVLPAAIIAAKGDLADTSYGVMILLAFLLWPRHRVGAGVAFGYAYLVRPEALLIVAGLTLLELVRRRRLPLGLLAGAAPWVIAYAIFVHHHTGAWALTGKMGFLARAQDAHPGLGQARLVVANLGSFLPQLPGMLGLPLVLLALVGFWRRPRGVYVALGGLALLPFFDFAMASRYWLPYVPFVLLAAAHGAGEIVTRWRRFPARVVAVACASVVVAGLTVASLDEWHWVRYNPEAYDGIRDAGLWLHGQVKESTRIAAYKPFASFWANCEFVKYPEADDIMPLLDQLEERGVDYLEVNAHIVRTYVPALIPLLGRDVDPRLKARVEPLRIFNPGPPDQVTVVFRLKSAGRGATRESGAGG
jgi:hypothetical protein